MCHSCPPEFFFLQRNNTALLKIEIVDHYLLEYRERGEESNRN